MWERKLKKKDGTGLKFLSTQNRNHKVEAGHNIRSKLALGSVK